MMEGQFSNTIIEETKNPHAAHIPIPVPALYAKAIEKQLQRNVSLGVIEPVPLGTSAERCSRKVSVAILIASLGTHWI